MFTEKEEKALNTILDYLEESESKSYEEYVSEGGDPKKHVYWNIKVVRKALRELPLRIREEILAATEWTPRSHRPKGG